MTIRQVIERYGPRQVTVGIKRAAAHAPAGFVVDVLIELEDMSRREGVAFADTGQEVEQAIELAMGEATCQLRTPSQAAADTTRPVNGNGGHC